MLEKSGNRPLEDNERVSSKQQTLGRAKGDQQRSVGSRPQTWQLPQTQVDSKSTACGMHEIAVEDVKQTATMSVEDSFLPLSPTSMKENRANVITSSGHLGRTTSRPVG